jgi:hypothetical protein
MALAAAWFATPAFAAKGGGRATSGSATVSASPNPVAPGGEYHIIGCGYTASPVNIVIYEPPTATFSGSEIFFGTAAINGCINAASWADDTPGSTYTIRTSQTWAKHQVQMASTTLVVQAG